MNGERRSSEVPQTPPARTSSDSIVMPEGGVFDSVIVAMSVSFVVRMQHLQHLKAGSVCSLSGSQMAQQMWF